MSETGSSIRGILGIQDPIEVVTFRAAPVGIIVADADGIIYMSNRKAEEMLASPYPLQGNSVHEFVENPQHPDWVREFVDQPSRAAVDLGRGRPVIAKTMEGNPIEVYVTLGHTMFDGTRLAIAILAEPGHGIK